ncbi:MAG: hypothetical protein AVDCRST_MAG50-229, partial [uncultured Acidimicrobiales bacterium]
EPHRHLGMALHDRPHRRPPRRRVGSAHRAPGLPRRSPVRRLPGRTRHRAQRPHQSPEPPRRAGRAVSSAVSRAAPPPPLSPDRQGPGHLPDPCGDGRVRREVAQWTRRGTDHAPPHPLWTRHASRDGVRPLRRGTSRSRDACSARSRPRVVHVGHRHRV